METPDFCTQNTMSEEPTRRTLLTLSGAGLFGGLLAHVFSTRSAHAQSSIFHAMWVHGTSLTIENPEALEMSTPLGHGMEIVGKKGQTSWIHFAIPTPVIVRGFRLMVGSMMVDFNAAANARISEIALWDGATKLIKHQGTLTGRQTARVNIPFKKEVRRGINVSVLCEWGAETTGNRITFYGAGVDLYSS